MRVCTAVLVRCVGTNNTSEETETITSNWAINATGFGLGCGRAFKWFCDFIDLKQIQRI